MTSFLTEEEIKEMGFKSCGRDVKISRHACFYGASEMTLGDHVRIDDFCILSGHVELGNYVHVAAYSAIFGGDKGVYMDDFSSLSSRVTIYAVNDDYSGGAMTNPTVPEQYKCVTRERVRIGKHAIIGATSVILPGVSVGEGSSFGSFSLINRDSEAWSVNAGIPFKKIRDRRRDLLKMEEQLMEAEQGL